ARDHRHHVGAAADVLGADVARDGLELLGQELAGQRGSCGAVVAARRVVAGESADVVLRAAAHERADGEGGDAEGETAHPGRTLTGQGGRCTGMLARTLAPLPL